MAPQVATWDAELAQERARTAYRYVAKVLPSSLVIGTLEAIGRADREVLEAEMARDWARYEEALREMSRVARRVAASRAA